MYQEHKGLAHRKLEFMLPNVATLTRSPWTCRLREASHSAARVIVFLPHGRKMRTLQSLWRGSRRPPGHSRQDYLGRWSVTL